MWSLLPIIIGSKLGIQFFIIMNRLFIYRVFLFESSTIYWDFIRAYLSKDEVKKIVAIK